MTKTKRNMHCQTTTIITATEITQTGGYFYKYTFRSIDRSLRPAGPLCHKLFCFFGDFYVWGTQDRGNKITASSDLANNALAQVCRSLMCKILLLHMYHFIK